MTTTSSESFIVARIASLEELTLEVRELQEIIRQSAPDLIPAWLSLRKAAELKGVSYETLRKQDKRYWPAFGHGSRLTDDARVVLYRREDVLAWCGWDADEIDRRYNEYLLTEVQKKTARGNER